MRNRLEKLPNTEETEKPNIAGTTSQYLHPTELKTGTRKQGGGRQKFWQLPQG